MANSIKTLVTKAKYGSQNAKEELEYALSTAIDTGLVGFNNEKITFNLTDNIKTYLSYIESNIDSVTKSEAKEVIILDSYSSATIEGARTSIEEVNKAVNSTCKDKSTKMVLNTIAGTKQAIEIGVHANNIRFLWETVVQDVCENEHLKGTIFRLGKVYVGDINAISHETCPVEKLDKNMQYLFKFSYSNILIYICIVHFYFVYIHPFCDGNGRLARIWTYSDLIRKYNSNFKYISISNEILNTVNEYYIAIEKSEYVYANQINITPFIEYILLRMCDAICTGKDNTIGIIKTQ